MTYTVPNAGIAPALDSRAATAVAAVAVGVLALVFRVGLLGMPSVPDEYFHLLAAQGWLETGRPTILDGEYTRVMWFTGAVAWFFSLTGSATLETGRLVALVAGVLIPAVLFLWLKARAGWIAAGTGAALAIAWPQGIQEAQILRFYSWHCLTFLVGAIAVFEAMEARGARWIGWAVLAALSLAVAFYLQITTVIGIAAILGWGGIVLILPAVWRHPQRWALLGGLAALAMAALAALALTGVLADLWAMYRWTPAWNEHRQDQVTYYNDYLRSTYPVFWPLFPLAALLAFRQQPRLTAYCAIVFGVILVGQSFGGMKALRYLSYGMPFFFAVLAVAAAAFLPAAAVALMRAAGYANPTRFRWLSAGLVLAAALFAAFVNPFFGHSIDAIGGRDPSGPYPPDWTRMPKLAGEWRDAPFILTTRAMHTIDSLGDYDVALSESTLSELAEQSEFSVDPRTGRPVVGELDTIATILHCEPEGLLVADGRFWGYNEDDWMPLFEAAGRTVEIRRAPLLLALHWSGGEADRTACAALPQ